MTYANDVAMLCTWWAKKRPPQKFMTLVSDDVEYDLYIKMFSSLSEVRMT